MSSWLRKTSGLAIATLLVAAACGSSAVPTLPAPKTSGNPAAWLAARVEQPSEIEALPTNAPGFCSPCHPILGTYITGLVATPSGFLAVGRELPPSRAAAWTASADASEWKRDQSLPAPAASGIAAAVSAGNAVLAVGTSGGTAAVWHATAGKWRLDPLPSPGQGMTEQLAAVAHTSGGYVAAGFEQDALGQKRATFWRSADGESWGRVDFGAPSVAPSGARGGAPTSATEVTGLAASGHVVVAVGIVGDERRGTAAAWRSDDDGNSWIAASSPSFGTGRMLAVAAGTRGFVAVGENVNQTAAAAWSSSDGSTWSTGGGSGLVYDGLEMVMTAVTAAPSGGFVADGWRSDAGNGSAVVWDSTNGQSWIRKPQDVTFSGAGMAAILRGPRLLTAGTIGWPDTHAAQVWLAPVD